MSAWTVIAHIEVPSGGQTSIAFASIPSTFTDIFCVISGRNSIEEDQLRVKLNDSSSNFSTRLLYGGGSSQGSLSNPTVATNFPGWSTRSGFTSNTFSNISFYIPNYAGNTSKSISCDGVTENNATNSYQYITAMLWSNTAAITKFEIEVPAGNFVQYSSATLYGVLKGSSGGVTVS